MDTALRATFASFGAEFLEQDGVTVPLRAVGPGVEYEAAREGCAIFDGGDRGWLELHGADSVDFLQRLLSSDVKALPTGAGQWSAMLDARGKWITDLILYRFEIENESLIGMDCPAARLPVLRQSLERMHFGEAVSWTEAPQARLLVIGPEAEAALAARGLPTPQRPAAAAADPRSEGGPIADAALARASGLLVLRRPDRGAPCYEVLGHPDRVAEQAAALRETAAVPGGLVALDILRVEAHEARYGTDFDAECTLPESNEWRRASLTKGCYTGQEVVARIHTYGEAPRQLCPLEFDGEALPLAGCALEDGEGKSMGMVSSWVWSPLRDRAIGLGTVRRRAATDGAELMAVHPDRKVRTVVHPPAKVFG